MKQIISLLITLLLVAYSNIAISQETKNQNLDEKYSFIGDSYQGLRLVHSRSNSYYGYINEKGEEVIPCKYDYAEDFLHENALVSDSDDETAYYYINIDGLAINSNIYHSFAHGSSKYCVVESNDKWGFVDMSGNPVTEIIYDEISDYCFDIFIVKYNGYYELLDQNLEIVPNTKYELIVQNKDIDCFVALKDGKGGVIKPNGEVVVDFIYDEINRMHCDIVGKKDGKYYFMNNSFELLSRVK
ncbi:MAG: WG repeat-containing protein [Rikenellaceae bacterium]